MAAPLVCLLKDVPSLSGPDACVTYTYSTPGGVFSNSEDQFNCCATYVEFAQYARASTCGEAGRQEAARYIFSRLTTSCEPVLTGSLGLTYQRLEGYINNTCAQTYDHNNGITEAQCNDPNLDHCEREATTPTHALS